MEDARQRHDAQRSGKPKIFGERAAQPLKAVFMSGCTSCRTLTKYIWYGWIFYFLDILNAAAEFVAPRIVENPITVPMVL